MSGVVQCLRRKGVLSKKLPAENINGGHYPCQPPLKLPPNPFRQKTAVQRTEHPKQSNSKGNSKGKNRHGPLQNDMSPVSSIRLLGQSKTHAAKLNRPQHPPRRLIEIQDEV